MHETQAYPENPDYHARTQQTFVVGEAVRVGPAYQAGGSYAPDGQEGPRYVVRVCGDSHYRVALTPQGDYLCTVFAARLVPRLVRCLGCGDRERCVDGVCSHCAAHVVPRGADDDGWGEARYYVEGYDE